LDPDTPHAIRSGRYRLLFQSQQIVAGKEDASNIYARGYYSLGTELIDVVMDRVRQEAENCDSLSTFLIFHALSGGTGSGFGALLMDSLSAEFGRKGKLDLCAYSGPQNTVPVTEAYNSVLSLSATLETCDCSFLVDNRAVSDICRRNLGDDTRGYENVNQLIGQGE
jgi:tubulin alpha